MAATRRPARRLIASMGAAALFGMAAAAGAVEALPALARLEPGLWQIRETDRGSTAKPRQVCVADAAMLMQLQHGAAPCSRMVIESTASSARVHYTCPANGFGNTTVRVETPRLAKIHTQGIMDNVPFEYRAEARRLGSCSKTTARR